MTRTTVFDDHPLDLAGEELGDTGDVDAISVTTRDARILDSAPGVGENAVAQRPSTGAPAAGLKTNRQDVVRSVRRRCPTAPSRRATAPDAYCRRCHATFQEPLPQPYGAICPICVGDGHIVTLTASVPRRMRPLYPAVADRGRGRRPGIPQPRRVAAHRGAMT